MGENPNGEQGSINLDDVKDIDKDLSGEEDPAVLKEHAIKATNFAKQAVARAKKAEAKLKENPPEKKTPETPPASQGSSDINKPVLDADAVDIRVLKAQGMPEEEINYLKKIAKLNETSIIEAQSDETFIAWKEKREATAKAEKARLGASQGSGSGQKKKDLNTPGLSDAEHKEMWKEQSK